VLALKTEFPLKFCTVLSIFFTIQDFWATLWCPEKQSSPGIFHCMEYTFYIQNFWAICMRLPWKTELHWYFLLYLNMYFLSFRIFEQLALALKNRVVLKLFAVWNILFTFWIFEQLALALKNRGFLEFTVPNIYFLLFRSFE